MTITGTNLANASAVDFGSVQVSSFVSDTTNEITLVSPPGSGAADVSRGDRRWPLARFAR